MKHSADVSFATPVERTVGATNEKLQIQIDETSATMDVGQEIYGVKQKESNESNQS